MTDTQIAWQEWTPDVFRRAKTEDKPILLRLSAVWCHWCHVQDQTSDRVPEALRLIQERYVPVRVDIDKHPDIRERYNFGGFPTTAFLTPDGDILTGGTYIPPDAFPRLLEAVAEQYHTRKEEIQAQIEQHRQHEREHEQAPLEELAEPDQAARNIVETVATSVLVNFDGDHGGFGQAPKFPHSAALEFALRRYQDTHEAEYATVVRKSLAAMAEGSLWDGEEKGFFRYSVTADWSEPHYEKMLEGNAGHLSTYGLAGGVLGDEASGRVARELAAYIERTLRNPDDGLFYGSQDADEHYYALPLAERRTKTAPYVDRTVYTDWAAMMIGAYFDAHQGLGDPRFLTEGVRSLESLLERMQDSPGALHHYAVGAKSAGSGHFSDHVYVLYALLRGHELSCRPDWLARAERLYTHVRATYWEASQRRFLDRAPSPDAIGRLARKQASIVENGVALRCLVRLHALTGNARYHEDAQALLSRFGPEAERWGIFASDLALGALEYARTPLEVNVVADEAERTRYVQEAARILYPFTLLREWPLTEASQQAQKRGVTGLRPPAAFLCRPGACSRLYRPGESFAEDARRLLSTLVPH